MEEKIYNKTVVDVSGGAGGVNRGGSTFLNHGGPNSANFQSDLRKLLKKQSISL